MLCNYLTKFSRIRCIIHKREIAEEGQIGSNVCVQNCKRTSICIDIKENFRTRLILFVPLNCTVSAESFYKVASGKKDVDTPTRRKITLILLKQESLDRKNCRGRLKKPNQLILTLLTLASTRILYTCTYFCFFEFFISDLQFWNLSDIF